MHCRMFNSDSDHLLDATGTPSPKMSSDVAKSPLGAKSAQAEKLFWVYMLTARYFRSSPSSLTSQLIFHEPLFALILFQKSSVLQEYGNNFICLRVFFGLFFCFFFLALHLQHMEVPRLGVKPAYTTTTATPDPAASASHSSWQCWIFNPLSKARD